MGFRISVGLLAAIGAGVLPLAQSYTLVDTYDYTSWNDMFSVQEIHDPTEGFVSYVSADVAASSGLMKSVGEQVFIGVDNETVLDPTGPGRNSVRLSSNAAYNKGLFIADFQHVPGSQCGSWPAYWLFGPNWPNNGEIDILEGINDNSVNQVTLHTSPGCVPSIGEGGQTGDVTGETDCGGGGGSTGCGVFSTEDTSYGSGFNGAGGVYAMEWQSTGIKVWYFSRDNVPDTEVPDPASWGQPTANYCGCDFDSHFADMNIIFDITFCGVWAGNVWPGSTCAASTGNDNCVNYVAGYPEGFDESYWLINSIKVFQ